MVERTASSNTLSRAALNGHPFISLHTYKQLVDEVFMISGIFKVSVSVIIIPDINPD